MTFKEIQELVKLVAKTELSEVKIKEGDVKIHIRGKSYVSPLATPAAVPAAAPSIINVPGGAFGSPAAAATPPPPASAPAAPTSTPDLPPTKQEEPKGNYREVKSPMIGTFYRSSSPDKPPYVKVGDTIAKGDTVAIVEAMKLFNEIEAEFGGKIVKVLVEDAQPIEYDQPLFLVEPA